MKAALLVLSLGLAMSIVSPARAGSAYPLTNLQEGQLTMKGHYGDDRTTAVYTVKKDTRNGAACLHVTWDSTVKRIEAWLHPDGRPIHTLYQKLKTGERVEIDYTGSGATYRYGKGGETRTTQVEEPGMIEALVIDVLLFAFPFENPREVVAPMIDADSEGGSTYRLYAELDEVEDVTVAGKTQKAYKIKVGVKGISGLFAPTFYFWYSVEKPHRYLKYTGPDEEFVFEKGDLRMPEP